SQSKSCEPRNKAQSLPRTVIPSEAMRFEKSHREVEGPCVPLQSPRKPPSLLRRSSFSRTVIPTLSFDLPLLSKNVIPTLSAAKEEGPYDPRPPSLQIKRPPKNSARDSPIKMRPIFRTERKNRITESAPKLL